MDLKVKWNQNENNINNWYWICWTVMLFFITFHIKWLENINCKWQPWETKQSRRCLSVTPKTIIRCRLLPGTMGPETYISYSGTVLSMGRESADREYNRSSSGTATSQEAINDTWNTLNKLVLGWNTCSKNRITHIVILQYSFC